MRHRSGARRPGATAARVLVGAAVAAPTAASLAVAGYLGVVTAAAWRAVARGEHRTVLPPAPSHRFVVLVPAHDEERLIGSSLDSLAALDYPAWLFSVHVVCDNCTDATAAIVRGRGAEAHERVAPDDPGKGPALGWLLQRLWDRGEAHDAVVVIDADTTVSPNLLRVADARLAAGASVVQAHYAVREAEASPTTAFRAAALSVRHYLRPLGRTHLGGSTGLYGNGMVFAAAVLRTRSFSSHLTEDIELGLDLLLDGTTVAFAPDAVVEAEMPTSVEASQTQHERWERGRLEMARRYVPRLVRRAVTGGPAGRVAYADAAVDQLLPPFSLVAAGAVGATALAALAALVAPGRRSRRRLLAAVAACGVQAAYVLSGLRLVDAPAAVYRSLAQAPKLVLWKVGLWFRVLRRPDGVAWVRTARNDDTEPTHGNT